MRRSRVAGLAVLLGMALLPLRGFACTPWDGDRLPCCDDPAAACHEMGAALSCCRTGDTVPEPQLTSVAERSVSRHETVLGPVAVLDDTLVPLPFGSRARLPGVNSHHSPPSRPLALRL